MSDDDVRRVCAEAADYIGEHGWHQGAYAAATGEVCMLGAVRRVLGERESWGAERSIPLFMYVERHIGLYLVSKGLLRMYEDGEPMGTAALYNDAEGTTKEDAIMRLKEASVWEGN